ncbi:MAG TPA: coproporphyrinogen III oxidase, partial [Casimicrobiaceae bacterium]
PTLIGLGASSIGHLPQGYVQNATRIGDYAEHMAEGRLATVRGCLLDDGDRRRAAIIEQLMCNYRAELGSVAVSIDELEADGLIRRSGGSIEVVDEAKPLVRVVAAAFDAYLPSSAAQHVTAV